MGLQIISVPYFLQLSKSTVKFWFDLNLEIGQIYPHGFIDEKVIYPSDFNIFGVEKFFKELTFYKLKIPDVAFEIIDNLEQKEKQLDKILIYPSEYWEQKIKSLK